MRLAVSRLPQPVVACGLALSGWMAASASGSGETSWSFLPLQVQDPPAVEDTDWPRNRIDRFVLAELEKRGLAPAPPADDRVLLRRLHFALTGLPPSAEEVASFDRTRVGETIDALLDSPHYGERWARHWLDLARYTDTTSSWLKLGDTAWLYRDWVVDALNDDMPYDEFIRRQLATDLLPETGPEDHAALGFLGLSPTYWKELQLPPEIIRTTVADEWEERVDAVGRTFLGLTLACARCHDHKSDPITMRDYYALAGVFASVRITERPTIDEALWQPVAKARAEVAKLEERKKALQKEKPEDLEDQLAEIAKRTREIQDATPHYHVPTAAGVVEAALYVKPKADGAHGTHLDYREGEVRDLAIHRRGNPNDLGEVVPRGFLSAFPGDAGEPLRFSEGSGRLELARALVEEAAPLTARVIVNRVWRHHFGRGLVQTPSDFGSTGDSPSHPELLDDLAYRLIENDWSLQWLHREILDSATWQQASVVDEALADSDPENRNLSRMARRRLDVEVWRDAMLAATGELDETRGGKPGDLAAPDFVRRTLYGRIHRRDLDPMLRVHDFPDPAAHNPARTETSTPLQQLFSLNSPFIEARAEALAKRLESEAGSSEERIELAYALLFQRSPSERERELGSRYLASGEPLARYSQVLLTGNEFLFLD